MFQRLTKLSFLAVLLAAVALSGCGDTNYLKGISSDSGGDTKMEEGLAYLDAGNFDAAIAKLTPLPDSQTKRKYLASAYLGKAGFDTLELISIINENEEDSNGASESVLWTAIGELLGGADGKLDSTELAFKNSCIEKALQILFTGSITSSGKVFAGAPMPSVNYDLLDDNVLLEAGIASAIHAILSVSSQMADGYDFIINPASVPVNKRQISSVPATFVADLETVSAALDRLAGDNGDEEGLLNDFQNFLDEIGYSNDGVVTLTELQNYINGL